ncbi:hypothetical protein AB0O69_14755 [Streptomyces xiamenensis]|jgi:hypothetical protein|uniref:hypothetical protein n=1 Tax=Streptomyces xiamenensis TaxID=408015 RepID=UPI00343F8309
MDTTAAQDGIELGSDPYDEKLHAYVRSRTPRTYALVEETFGKDGTARVSVVGWGLAFPTGPTEVVREGEPMRVYCASPESAADHLAFVRRQSVFLVWPDGDAPDGDQDSSRYHFARNAAQNRT